MLIAVISESTTVTLGVAAGIVMSVIGCTVWITNKLSGLDTKLSAVTERLDHIEAEHFTKVEAEAHALRLALENPGLNVPDPRNPGQIIRATK